MRTVNAAKFARQAACAATVLGLALPALAQQTTGNETDVDSAAHRGNLTATQPSGAMGETGVDRTIRDSGARYATTGGTRTDMSDTTRPSGVIGRPIGPSDSMRDPTGTAGDVGERRSGWVRVGFDYNDDGRFDSFDYVPANEAERLRSASARGTGRDMGERSGRGQMDRDQAGMGRSDQTWREEESRTTQRERTTLRGDRDTERWGRDMQDRRWGGRGEGMTSGQRWRDAQRFQGRVVNLSTMDVHDRQHLVAEIETSDRGKIQVDLGPRGRLHDRLTRLREGDRITVMGRRSDFHDRMLIIANRVESDGEWININVESDRLGRAGGGRFGDLGGQQYSGEIASTREAWFSGHDHSHLLARVRLEDQDWTTVVDLGPSEHLTDHRFSSGQQISFVARDGCINGQQALIADELTAPNGQFVQLDNYEAEETLQLRGDQFRGGQLRGRPVGPSNQFDSDRYQDDTFDSRPDRSGQYREGKTIERESTFQQRSLRRGAGDQQYRSGTSDQQYRSGTGDQQYRSGTRGMETEREVETKNGETEMEVDQ